MTISYFLFIVFVGQMHVVGPFHGLLACERAAGQVMIAAREAAPNLSKNLSTACLSQKAANFTFKEPK